jgi:hypothetical protein
LGTAPRIGPHVTILHEGNELKTSKEKSTAFTKMYSQISRRVNYQKSNSKTIPKKVKKNSKCEYCFGSIRGRRHCNASSHPHKWYISSSPVVKHEMDKPFTEEEYNSALKKLSKNSSCGVDEIFNEQLFHLGPIGKSILLNILTYHGS